MITSRVRLSLASSVFVVACGPTLDPDAGFTSSESVPTPEITLQRPHASGQIDPKQLAARAPRSADVLRKIQDRVEALAQRPGIVDGGGSLVPTPKELSKRAGSDGGLLAFTGLGIADVDTANGGPTGITPPDQGLCAGNGFVLEAVNSALQVYDIIGGTVGSPINPVAFFNFPADTATTLSFASDPKCYFDQAAGRFFATTLRIPVDPSTFAISGSFLDIAVSTSSDPRGTWNIYEVDLTDSGQNGTPNHAHCPCLGDQPLIGADTNGFYVTTNEFGLDPNSPGFNGAQIYGFSKQALVAGAPISGVHLANLVLANGIGFSIQPATSPSGTGADDANGSEYFLSSLDFDGLGDNRVALWALSNTASLNDETPSIVLEHAVLKSQTYAFPPAANQPATGDTPLRDCLAAGNCPAATGLGGLMATNTIEQIETNDDRMNQAVFAGGNVWAGLNTAVQVPSGVRAGIAFFQVEPRRLTTGRLGGKMGHQSYLALDDADVLFPSIALTDDGRGAIAFSLSGTNDFPSAAYVRVTGTHNGPIHVAGGGSDLLDDSAGYAFFAGQGQGPSRFGDYSAALIDGSTLWMASEAVTSSCATLDCPTRDAFTNWGTVVGRLDLADDLDK
jgi:hypothetical protein